MDIEMIKKAHQLDHEIFMKRCKILRYCLEGKNTEELEKEVEKQEYEYELLQKQIYKN